ncbi:MetQ/NlpA family ABC transporter substrate-binding protein [Telmatospirillum sp.]|uniref:MetQ/NlpA family ABC transporter substrate-binding protein n=1 Tax=Telmatospirillum sp. TaxID=2079197 RepID=UPI0028519677|nr:MetQ/NlpA family ABC transporter substrate-binding protein [Telmatospirillum sp.]MDR3437837.1 MetQ/NlpA family ABC transporter substrate-binding protein [Telmatospirillum sp.]
MTGHETFWLKKVGMAVGLAVVLMASTAQAADKIRLGVMGGAEEEIAQVVKNVAATKGLDVELVTFSDYVLPNEALENHELDANAFQHKPYLDAQKAAHGYHIIPLGATIVEPIGLYSKKIKSLDALPKPAKIGIPNDPSNGGRALKLLAANGLITVADDKGLTPSLADVQYDPKKIKLIELDAALLPRTLDDLDAAVINTNHALNGGLDPRKDALIQEPRQNNPYGNFIAVREADKDKPALKALVAAYQSPEVAAFLETRFKGAILPAW